MQRCVLFLLLAGSLLFHKTEAQSPSIYNGYIHNPFFYNPAEAITNYTTVNLMHRRQWIGIDGAPTATAFTLTSRIGEGKSGFGLKFVSLEEGLVSNNTIDAAYVYGIPLSLKQALHFGMSFGMSSRAVDFSQLDMNDPAIGNFTNTIDPVASFGLAWKNTNGLNLGVSLPRLISRESNISESGVYYRRSFAPDEIIVTASFARTTANRMVTKNRRGVKRKMQTGETRAPLELYTLYKYSRYLPAQAEAFIKLNLSDAFAIAGGYRLNYGPLTALHLSLGKMAIQYAYEPAVKLADFTTSSHEFQLALQIGKDRKPVVKTPQLRSRIMTSEEHHVARFQQGEDQTNAKETTKYYVVIRSFKDFTPADAYKRKLVGEKFNGNVIYSEKDKMYHVYVYKATKSPDAYREAKNLKLHAGKKARVIAITTH